MWTYAIDLDVLGVVRCSVLAVGGDGSSSGCVDVGVGRSSGPKCMSPAQQWKISSTSSLLIPKHMPWHHHPAAVVSVDTSVLMLVEVDGSMSDIVGLLVIVSIEANAAEDVMAVGVSLANEEQPKPRFLSISICCQWHL